MNFLFGSGPKVTNSTNPTTTGGQQALLGDVGQWLAGGQAAPGVSAYGGTFGAPLSGLQSTSLQAMENLVNGIGGQPQLDISQVLSQYGKSLNPNVTAPNVGTPNVTAQTIDPSQVIQSSVVDPLMKSWNESILPGIIGSYGRGAGGAFSSDAMEAKQQAGRNLESTIASESGQIGFQAASTNASNALTAGLANQSAGLSASEANATNSMGAQTTNISALLSALGMAPGMAGLPYAGASSLQGLLSSTLAGGAVPQATQQTQLTGQYQDYLNQINQTLQRIGLASGVGTTPTLQTNTTASQGSSGLIPGLLMAFAQGAGKGVGAGA